MALFDIKKRDRSIDTLSSAELGARITEKKKEIEQLKVDIDFAKSENEKLEDSYLKKIKELDEKQAYFNSQIEEQREAYNVRITRLESKRDAYKKEYEAKIEILNSKVQELEEKEKSLFEHKSEMSASNFRSQQKEIKGLIEKTKEDLKNYNDLFNKNIDDSNEKYKELLAKKEKDLESINKKKNEFIIAANSEIDKLEQERDRIENYHKEQLKRLSEEQTNVENIVKVQEENDIKQKEKELAGINEEIKSLQNFRNSLMSDLEHTRLAHEREYNILVSKYDNEKENLVRENNLLKNELDDKQRRYDEEVKNNKISYEYQLNEVNRLLDSLDSNYQEVRQKLDSDAKAQESDLIRQYKNFIDDLEKQYNVETKAREEELASLKFELAQEEEKAKNEKAYLDVKLENATILNKNSLKDKVDQIAETQRVLNNLEFEHNNAVKEWYDKITNLKSQNADAISSKQRENTEALKKLKADYEEKRLTINKEIDSLKEKVDYIKDNVAKAQAELSEYNEEKEQIKKGLLSEHEEFVSNQQHISKEITSKIDEIKTLIANNIDKYNENLEKLNKRKVDSTNEAENRIKELNSEYQKTIQQLKDDYDQRVLDATNRHEEKISSLTSDYNRKCESIREVIEEREKELESYRKETDFKIDELRINSENRITDLNNQNKILLANIETLKKTMTNETAEYDSEVKTLENDYLAKLDDMAKIHNQSIQIILNEYETIPSIQLDEIKGEYDRISKEYTSIIDEISNNKRSLDEQEADLKYQINVKRKEIEAEVSSKELELDRLKRESENQQTQQQRELTRISNEVENIVDENKDKINETTDENQDAYNRYSNELNEKYRTLVNSLREKQDNLIRQNEESLNNVELDSNTRIANINSLIRDLNDKRTAYENQYSDLYNSALANVNASKNALEELNIKRNAALDEYNSRIGGIKLNNQRVIDNKSKEYESQLDGLKVEYSAKRKDIYANINQVKSDIETITNKIDNANKDFESYKKDSERHVLSVKDEFDAYLAYAKQTKDEIDNNINKYRKQIADSTDKYNADIRELDNKREEEKRNFERIQEDIKRDFEKKIADLESVYGRNVEEAKNNNQVKINELQAEYNRKVNEIKALYDEKNAEYIGVRDSLQGTLDSIKEEFENKINTINEQRKNIEDSIANLRPTIENEKEKYYSTVKVLETEQQTRLADMVRQFNVDMDQLIDEYYTVPNRELTKNSDELNAKQREYNARLEEIEKAKKEIDDKSFSLESHNSMEKKTIESEITILNSELDRTKAEYESVFSSLNADYQKHQLELDDYKQGIAKLIRQLKDDKANDEKKHIDELEERFNILVKQLEEEAVDEKNRLEDDYNKLNADLNAKKNNLTVLIDELEKRKESSLEEYTITYDRLAKDAEDGRKQLQELQKEHDERANIYKNNLIDLNKQNIAAIDEKTNEYKDAIEKAKLDYSAKRREIEKEIVRSKLNLEEVSQKLIDINRDFDRFVNKSNTHRQSTIAAHNDYIANSNAAINSVMNSINDIKEKINTKQIEHNAEIEKINLKRKDIEEGYKTNVVEVNRIYEAKLSELDYNHGQRVAEAQEQHKHVLADLKNEYKDKVKAVEDSYDQKKEEYRILKKNYNRDLQAIKEDAQDKINKMDEQQKEIERSVNNLKNILEEEKVDYENQVRALNDANTDKLNELEKMHNDAIANIINEKETLPTKSLEEVRNQLDRVQKEYDDRVITISKEKKELDNKELTLASRCNEERNNADTELAIRNEEYTKLKNDKQSMFNNFDATLKDRQAELDSFSKDISNKIKEYRQEKEADFIKITNDLEAKYVDVTNANSLNEQSVQSNYNNEVVNLKNRLSGKMSSVDRKINAILEEQNRKRNDYEQVVFQKTSEFNVLMPSLKKQLEELSVLRDANAEAYKTNIEQVEKDNQNSIRKRSKELDEQLENARENYDIESINIAKSTESLRKQIEKVNKNLALSNSEFESYVVASEARNRKILAEQDDYLQNVAKQKTAVDEKINKVNVQISDKQAEFKREMDTITVARNQAQTIYDNKVAIIEREYQARVDELTVNNNAAIAEARKKHEARLIELSNEFNVASNAVRNSFEEKKLELKNLKANNRQTIEKIKEDVNNKVEELKSQQDELLSKINEVKAVIKVENQDYNDKTQELQKQYDTEISILAEENKKRISEMYHTYVEIPNIEFQRVTDEFNAKQLEYENTVKNFDQKKHELDEHENEVIKQYQRFKEESKDSLTAKKQQYDDTYNRLKALELDLETKLNEEKKKAENLQIDLDKSVEEIREEKAKQLEVHAKKLDDDFANKEQHFKDVQILTAKRNENEISILKDHLNAKKDSVDSLINEIYARREKVEEEKSIIYNQTVAETNKLQKELDEIVADNAMQKTEIQNQLISKKKEYDDSIEVLKQEHNQELEVKKQEFIKAKSEKDKQIDEIQHKILELTAMKDETNEKLASYEKEKNASVESINKDLENFTINLNKSMNELAAKRSELEISHNDRIAAIKSEIAQAISEYDDLIRLKPQVIADANAEEIDFETLTMKFREKLKNLERSHMAVMDELDAKRVQTITSITTEISQIEETKPEKLKKYEDEIANLSATYDAMLREERNKQTHLNKNIEIANKEKQRLEADSYKSAEEFDKAFIDRENYLNKEFQDRIAESNANYIKMSEDYKNEFNQLANKRDYLSERLIELNNGFVKIDNEIHKELIFLKSNYNSKLMDIQRQYEATINFNREKLKEIDVMSIGNKSLLFKR